MPRRFRACQSISNASHHIAAAVACHSFPFPSQSKHRPCDSALCPFFAYPCYAIATPYTSFASLIDAIRCHCQCVAHVALPPRIAAIQCRCVFRLRNNHKAVLFRVSRAKCTGNETSEACTSAGCAFCGVFTSAGFRRVFVRILSDLPLFFVLTQDNSSHINTRRESKLRLCGPCGRERGRSGTKRNNKGQSLPGNRRVNVWFGFNFALLCKIGSTI